MSVFTLLKSIANLVDHFKVADNQPVNLQTLTLAERKNVPCDQFTSQIQLAAFGT
jgi:hypothetical protein